MRSLSIEVPFQYTKNVPRIGIEFKNIPPELYGELVTINLVDTIKPSKSIEFIYSLQETSTIEITGVPVSNYSLSLSGKTPIDIQIEIYCLNRKWHREAIDETTTNIIIPVVLLSDSDRNFDAALMTSGSFTMMATDGF